MWFQNICEKVKRKKNNHIYLLLFCIIINAIGFLYLIKYNDPIFGTNDDYRMRLIVSGQYFGEPLKDAVFLNVVLSWGLKSLYCLNSNIEWYGLYMFIAMYISCTIVHYIFVKNSSTFKSLLIKNVQYIIIFILLLYRQLLMVQFTMVAAMLCMAAIACLVEWAKLYTKNNKLHNWYFILFVFCFLLSLLTRKKVSMMGIPIIMIIVFMTFIQQHLTKRMLLKALIGVLVILCPFAVNLNYYVNEENLSYNDFNIMRSKVMDYKGLPDFQENKQFYRSINMDETAYNALESRNFDMDPSISTENLEKIKEYSNKINEDDIFNRFVKAVNNSFQELTGSETVYTTITIAFMLILAFYYRNQLNLFEKLLLCIIPLYYYFSTVFFLFTGRIMVRLIDSVAIISLGIYFSICNHTINNVDRPILNKCISVLFILSTLFPIFGNCYQLFGNKQGIRSYTMKKSDELIAIEEHARKNPDNFYFYNSLDFIACSDYVFRDYSRDYLNMDCLGNWYSKSKVYYERNKQYGYESAVDELLYNPSVFYIEEGNYHASIDGVMKKNGKQFVLIDTIVVDEKVLNIYHSIDLDTTQ